MAVSDTLTYDETPPRRPGLDDLQEAPKEQPAGLPPPNPRTCPTAQEANQQAEQIAGLAKVSPVLVVSCVFDSGSSLYDVSQFACPGTLVDFNTFTATRNSQGDISVTWPTDTFPGAAAQPEGSANGSIPCLFAVRSISNGFRVVLESTGGPIDSDFTVSVF